MTMADNTTQELSEERQTRIAAVKARLQTYDDRAWNDILREALETRESWDHSAAELTPDEAPPGARGDEPWGPAQIMNHLGGFFLGISEQLQRMLDGESGDYDAFDQWQGDDLDLDAIRSGAIRGWDQFIERTMIASSGAADATLMEAQQWGALSPKRVVAFALGHAATHVAQMRAARGLAEDENPADPAGQLGKKRRGEHLRQSGNAQS
jgi:hypothetical protein